MPVIDAETESLMLDSIRSTLTRMLGSDSARVVEYYVDQNLAFKDPVAFEEALNSFLGSRAGELVVQAIKADLLARTSKSMPEEVSRFLKAPRPNGHGQPTTDRTHEGDSVKDPITVIAPLHERFFRVVREAAKAGIGFRELVTEAMVANEGETCGYATLACLGVRALNDPQAFTKQLATIFGLQGAVLLQSLADFTEKRLAIKANLPA